MLRYASSETICRNQFLLSYFGQLDARRCGRCDVCRSEKGMEPDSEESRMIMDKIAKLLSVHSETLDYLVAASGYESGKVLPVVDWLVDQGRVVREKDLKLRWK